MSRNFTKKQKLVVALAQDVDPQGLEADHIRPYAKDGETTVANCQLISPSLNRHKGDKFMLPRWWQEDFENKWNDREPGRPFLLAAIPAAGKTYATLRVAQKYIRRSADAKLVIIAPSITIREHWQKKAANDFGIQLQTKEFYGSLKLAQDGRRYDGVVATYQWIAGNALAFTKLCSDWSVLVVFDEVHHCGDEATWGSQTKIAFELAKEKLLLSGTLWRTDGRSIPFVPYDAKGLAIANYRYDRSQALEGDEDIIRYLAFYHIGGRLNFKDKNIVKEMHRDLTDDEAQALLRPLLDPDGEFVRGLIKLAHEKLQECREYMKDAAAMAICREITHAKRIAQIIKEETGCDPFVILSDDDFADNSLDTFEASGKKWLVSIRKVSEGADCPRLQVLCYLTNWTTELHFYQAVGRVDRHRGLNDDWAYVYLPNHPRLFRYAENIEDIQGVALDNDPPDEGEFNDDDTSRDRTPKPTDECTSELSGDDVTTFESSEGRRYAREKAEYIERIANKSGIPLKQMVEAFDLMEVEPMPEQMPVPKIQSSSTPEEPLERVIDKKRSRIKRRIGRLFNLTGEDFGHIHARLNRLFNKPQHKQTLDELIRKERILEEEIARAENDRRARGAGA